MLLLAVLLSWSTAGALSSSKSSSDTLYVSPSLLLDDLQNAVSLDITSDGTLLILERAAHHIRLYTPVIDSLSDPSHSAVAETVDATSDSDLLIGGYGFQVGAFADPVSIFRTSGGRTLIGESESARVQLFDSRWIPISSWDLESEYANSDSRFTNPRIRPDAIALLPDGSLLIADLTSRYLHTYSRSGQHRSSQPFPDVIPYRKIRQLFVKDDHLWLLNGSNGEYYRLTPNAFYADMSSCGFPAEAISVLADGILCANQVEFRFTASLIPLAGQFTREIPEPLTDILITNDIMYLLTSRSLYHVTLNP